MKKTINILIVTFICAFSLISLVFIALNFDTNVLEYEELYKETQSTQDLYNLCTVLQNSSNNDKIIEYYPLLLNDKDLDDFIKKDRYWFESLENLDVSDIIDTYIVTYLGAVCTISDANEIKKQIEIFGPQISFNIYNNIMPVLDVIELHFYKEIGVEISGVHKERTNTYLNALSDYVNDSDLTIEKRDFVNLFIYNWYSEINNIDKMNRQRTMISKLFTSEYFFAWEKELINGYKLVLNSADMKIMLGRDSYADKFLIDIGYDVEQYAFDNRYICVLQNDDEKKIFYIVDTQTDEIFGGFEKVLYEQKCRELGIKLELKQSEENNQGTDD